MNNKTKEPIAIVGMGAIMPGALSKEEFWQNIQTGKYCITEIPASYWDYKLFYSPDHKAEDKLYSKIGGFIPEGFKFNSIKYRIPPQIAKQMDTVQHLAIETTRMALEDSGYDKKEFNRDRCAVIIGNSMGGMKNEMSNTRLNRPFLYEILKQTPTYQSLSPDAEEKLMNEMDEGVRQKFTPITEDSMPGELANVIAGRLANVFDLHGTNFTVDAACATSLAAVDQAVNGLREGNFDMAIVGGVDQMMSPSAYIKFCKIGALSEHGSCPFDAKADGFVMAEGAGTVILKRLCDAVKDGDKVYAVIRAVGASSDGKGKGITAPNPKGQKIAVEKTFEQLDYTPGDVGLIEAHGTSTRVGDAVELNALYDIFGPYAKPGTIGLGSVKSQIGHAKAAAGIASLIKTSLALYNKVLPPSVNFHTPNPTVDWATSPFRVITQAEPWNTDKVRRANVSAFGFGGTNFHVALEEMNDDLVRKKQTAAQQKVCAAPISNPTPAVQEQVNMNATPYSLLVPGEKIQSDVLSFSADTKQDLFSALGKAVLAIEYDPTYLPRIAYQNHLQKPHKFAVAINVENPEKLKEKIEYFIKIASGQDVWAQESLYLKMKGIYPFTPSEIKPKVCFMFPGQGSQYVDMMKDLASKYKVVMDTFMEADRILVGLIGQNLTDTLWSKPGETKEQLAEREAAIKKTEMTQPAVLTADVAMMRLLSSFGLKPDVVMGHSLGEYAAAVAAGIFDFENGLKAVCTRAKAMADIKVEDNGKMASIAAPAEQVEPQLSRISGYVAVANKNCPTQTVIAGNSKSIDDAIKMFTDMGIQAVQIPVSHAFHSEIVRPAMPKYRAFLDTLTVHAPKMPITTNVTAEFYPSDPEQIKDLMVTQISHSVEWIKQLKTTYDSGVRLFVECGPKRVLSALATNTLSDKKDIKVLASNHPKKGGIVEFNDMFANLISSGIHIDWNGTDVFGDHSAFNPAFAQWAGASASAAQTPAPAAACAAQPTACGPRKEVVISGIAAGGPGSWDKVFREGVLDEILQGRNLIEPVSSEVQQKQIDKNVEIVIKSKDGNHRIEHLSSPAQAIKLAAKSGSFDLEKEFGLPAKWVASMDRCFQLAIAAGILALKDAGIPLVLYYKPTSTGGYLPDRWGLPEEMIDNTGVIFTSAYPIANSMMGEFAQKLTALLENKNARELTRFYETFINQISDPALKAELKAWYDAQMAKVPALQPFTSQFILKTIIIAQSHFAQWIRAKGPATSMSAACASTAQAISVAHDWIRLGRAKRVIVISADDITNSSISEWMLTAFLASGAATTQGDVTQAALPFDRRRNGMIVGMGAVSLVVEEQAEVEKRGMKPLAKLLASEIRNSGFHVTRLDVGHVAQVMNELVSHAEKEYGLNRSDIAKQLVFISHETYTPARGGSASAEAYALKSTFGKDVSSVIVSNTKGFTGHSMGAGLEDAIAVRCLNTGLVPPIANFKEADPELEGITLSKGGHYNFKYALRLAAGFGSQIGMTLLEKMWAVGEPRITDPAKHEAWLKHISHQENPVLEIDHNTLRVKDNYKHGVKPSLVMEGAQAFVDKVNMMASHAIPAAPVAQPAAAPAAQPAPAPVVETPAPVAAAAPAPKAALPNTDEASVTQDILAIVSEKTGYPEDMLDLDLDMEADLGIDTVKQAELFAIMREKYQIARQEGVQLKDYPTIRSIIKYAMENAGTEGAAPVAAAPVASAAQPAAAPAAQPAPASVVETPAPVVAVAPAPKAALPNTDEASVTKDILAIVSEKTGYPEDMLDLDLDMEADLGIDTVKQAELFAIMREKYQIARQEGVQLKDYPTIRSIIKYAMENAGTEGAAPVAAASVAPVAQPAAAPATETPAPAPVAVQPAAAPAPKAALPDTDEASVTQDIVALVAEKTGYPADMLDLDLDMEADLGIDTVKQAELFAIMREKYQIARQEGVQLKDYPTIRSIIKYAMENAGTEGAAPVAAASVAPVAQPAAAPATETPAPAPVAVQPAAAPAPKAALPDTDEASVTQDIVALVAEKTGYPADMLDLDLDMEADLGIDTVKQAELFAIMREKYQIARQEGVQLKDYPTIRSIIKYAMENAGTEGAATVAAAPVAPVAQPAAAPATETPAPASAPVVTPAAQPAPVAQPAAAPAPKVQGALDEAGVTKEIVAMVAEKTGYPEDMLDLDLDMEADLGIDTVKQAELFAAMREHYGIVQMEGIQLKDYPTIRHCIRFALTYAGKPAATVETAPVAQPAAAPAVTPAAETPAVQPAPAPAQTAPALQTPQDPALPVIKVAEVQEAVPTAGKVGKPSQEMLTTNPTGQIEQRVSLAERPEREGYAGEHCHEKKLRNVTVVADAPLTERENRRLAKDRTVLIFADNSQLIKAYQEEFKELGVKTHVFTTLKTRSKNTTIVNWESYEETEAALKGYAAEDPHIQGIVYLLGATVKKFDKKASPHNELTKYVMPLFIALRVFEKALAQRQDADTFFAVNVKIDGNFGYFTKDEFNPIVGALTGGTTCYRKDVYERTGAISKLLDFEPTATPDEMAQKTMDEVLHGDMRLMIGTRGGKRSTILSVPVRLDKSIKRFDLAGKTIIFTGSGRGIGAMLSQKIAAQYKSKIIVLDIIEIQEKTPLWASMNEAELAALKKQIWEELKADTTHKATPVMLERAFGRVKDSITLYNNLQKLRDLGSEVEYYHCDVLNSSMVKEVCTKIKARNGRVDGLIHFAGLERSKLIYDKDPAEYYRIFDVKATSFASFLANNIVRDDGFFAFASSIAGKYGNLGQSDYASANDYLAKSAFSLTNQGYRAIAIAMSAYKNVGMGVRAGVETFLKSNGVDFVDPEDGMQIFLDEIVYGDVPEIVLTGSLGRLDWDHQLRFEMDEIVPEGAHAAPQGGNDRGQGGAAPVTPVSSAAQPDPAQATHFLGQVASLAKHQELHAEKEFNLQDDPYLADHAIEGTPYVPGVMGIETFVETATALGGTVPQGLKDVHFYLPIKLLRNRPQAVRVIGKEENGDISMEIESDFINSKGVKMGNTRRHFTAHALQSGFVSTWDEVKDQIRLEANAAPQITKEEIYKKYFHGPSFQVLGGILKADKDSSLAVYNTTPRPQWNDGAKTLLANPMLIEAAFQCCGFRDMAIDNKMTLPDGIKELAVFKREVPPQKLYLYGRFKGLTADGKTLHDAYVFDGQGQVWVEIHGYQAIGQ